jgi:hypothetical protein
MRARGLLSLLALAVVLAGCGGSKTKTVTVSAPAKSTAQATTATGTATGTTAGQPAQAQPVATATSAVDHQPARLDVMSFKRSGDVAELTLRLTNLAKPGGTVPSAAIQVAQNFDDGLLGANGNDPDSVDGIFLVDGINRKKYLVARDSAGQCACDGNLGGDFVQPGQSGTLSATFPAPPPDVKEIDIHVPKFGTFKGVPIS